MFGIVIFYSYLCIRNKLGNKLNLSYIMDTFRQVFDELSQRYKGLEMRGTLVYKKKSEKDAESLVPHMNRAILGSLCIFLKNLPIKG